jgi:polyisoprenyl-teichoic acid--peptidoglycan teichoic acid transferase
VKKRVSAAAAPAASPVRRGTRRQRFFRRKAVWIVALILAGLLLITLLSGYLVWKSLTGRVNIIEPGEKTLPSEFDLPTESLVNPLPSETGIVNILLMGVDTRDENSIKERSDSMMILTIDSKNGKLKLTSLQRDMLVYVPGRSEPVKINAANAFGGPALALRAVNDNLRLDIQDFMIVNMYGMERLVDLAGGVMIDVMADEVAYINASVNEANILYPDTPTVGPVKKSGLQTLSGRQAVGYARIRKIGSDYKRMERQRTVMQALLDAFRSADLKTKTQIVGEGLSLITTNMSAATLTDLALKTLPMLDKTIEQMQIPIKGYNYEDARGSWVNRCDFNGMIPLLQQFIFGRNYPFDPVREIPGAPNSSIPLPSVAPSEENDPTPAPTTGATSATTDQTKPAPTTETSSTTQPAESETTVPTTSESSAATTSSQPAATT